MSEPKVVAGAPAGRYLRWIAIGLAIVGFAIAVLAAFLGGQLRWWQIALPALLIGNVAVTSFGVFQQSPRLKQAYFVASGGIALGVVVAIFRSFAR